MKPIFNREKLLLEELLDIKLPEYCWRDAGSIYLNCDSKFPIVVFDVVLGKVKLLKNIIKSTYKNTVEVEFKIKCGDRERRIRENLINYTWNEEIIRHKDEINRLEKESILKTKEFIWKHYRDQSRIGFSTGKDSVVLLHLMLKVFEELRISDYVLDFNNCTNDLPPTYHMIKDHPLKDKIQMHTPKTGWYKFITKVKKYFLPSVMHRFCCDKYKKGQMKSYLNKKNNYMIFLGMRRFESIKRADYTFELNEHFEVEKGFKVMPEGWRRFLPLLNWKDHHIWLYIMMNNISYNPLYDMGFNRVGCAVCPYQQDFTDILLQRYYPTYWNRWVKILEKNYMEKHIERNLKWTKEEWITGKWKAGVSKEYEIIQNKATPQRIKELAEIKGISEEKAAQYFEKKCCKCGKPIGNPDAVAMNLKYSGGMLKIDKFKCKDCFSKEMGWTDKQFKKKVLEFKEQGCSLF